MSIEQHSLTILCLLSALLGVSLIYYASLRSRPSEIAISDLSVDMVGLSATVRSEITKVRFHQDGHIFLTLSDGNRKLQVPLFSSFLRTNNLDISKLKVGTRVLVSGTVDIYNNQLQIVPKKVGDVKILGD